MSLTQWARFGESQLQQVVAAWWLGISWFLAGGTSFVGSNVRRTPSDEGGASQRSGTAADVGNLL